MELENPKDFPIVMIQWVDSNALREGGWSDVNLKHLKDDCLACVTAGFLIHQNESRYIICSSYYVQTDGETIAAIGLISIPEQSVDAMEWLYKPKEKELPIAEAGFTAAV